MLQPRRLAWSLVLLAALVSPACLSGGNSINAYGGARSLDASELDGLDDLTTYGADAVLKLDIPFLAVEGGYLHSNDDTSSAGGLTDPELTVEEYFVGLRLVPWDFLVEPYGSIGVSHIESDLDDAASTGGSDSSLGYYARLGAAMHFGFLRFGIDARYSFSDKLDLDALESDMGGYLLTGFIGIGF